MDDVVQPLFAPAAEIVGRMKACAVIFEDVFSLYGLTINFKRGKTEALFRMGGTGSVEANKLLFSECGGIIRFQSRGIPRQLVASAQYKHCLLYTSDAADDM
eukprot:3797219-Alexandrium_andersonii.AAC.1